MVCAEPCLIAARGDQGVFQRFRDIVSFHRGAQAPGDDVGAVVVEECRQIEPTPAEDLEIGEVGLLKLVRPNSFVMELIRRFDGMQVGLVIRSCAFRSL